MSLSAVRLERYLALLVVTGGPGCGIAGIHLDTEDSTACLTVAIDDACPTVAEADVALSGSESCTTPVEEVVRVVALGDRVPAPDSGDTGAPAFEQCCYDVKVAVHEGQGCVVGRVLSIDGAMVRAPVVVGSRWGDWGATPRVRGLDRAQREALAAYWADAARREHASIGSFA
ncbi:MAG: hypothetical protein ABMB14_38675, partial [Myxococcota bacterium]